jgi:hypothetical protein
MKFVKNVFAAALLTATLFTACKEEETQLDNPTINIISPTSVDTLMPSTGIPVKIEFSDEDQLHMYEVSIQNLSDSSVIFSTSGHKHHPTFTLDTTITQNVKMHQDYKLDVSVSNHHGGSTRKSVQFHVHM